ncbi:MAG: fibronectin type III domain-containing protein [Uliginosibacterium sp.]|nr:fibronectin type III domain-containing protein [Uliginosibacterium sp.]
MAATPDKEAPTPPGGLGFAGLGATSVILKWGEAVDNVGVAGFDIYRDGRYLSSVGAVARSYADTTVSPQMTYRYQLKARDAAGNLSAPSAELVVQTPAQATVTPAPTPAQSPTPTPTPTPAPTPTPTPTPALDTRAPSVPTGLAVDQVTTSSLRLQWQPSTDDRGVTAYGVYLDGKRVATVSGTAYTVTGLVAATRYALHVSASDAAGNASAASTAITVNTLPATSGVVAITQVSGALQHGARIQIQGLGFGVKSPAEPYFYDDFEAGAPGQVLWGASGALGSAKWLMYGGGANTDSVYTTEGYRGKGVSRVSRMNDFRDGYIQGLNADEAYVSYRFRYTHTGNWGGVVMKTMRIASLEGSNPIYSGQPALLQTYQPTADWLYSILSTDGTATGSSQKTITSPEMRREGQWIRLQGYLRLSVPAGAANGEYFVGTLNDRVRETDKLTRAVAYGSSRINSFLLPFTSANGGTQPQDILSQWADDVYFDRTQARIELCDRPSWAATDKNCELQIPRVSWTDQAIEAQVQLGRLAPGSTAYLYVVTASGAVNAQGFPVGLP